MRLCHVYAACVLLAVVRCRREALDCKPIGLRHGRVRYRKNGFAQAQCAVGYTLAGDRYVKCTSRQWEGVLPVCVRATCRPAAPPPHGFVYPSHRGAVLNFYCMAGYELAGPTTAFCDGARWSAHLPVCAPSNGGSSQLSLRCDFEAAAICGWTHDLNHNFDWTRNAKGTPSAFLGTGPAHDHTYGAPATPQTPVGHYMYVEASARNPDDVARLISPVHAPATPSNGTTSICLTFWYHMYGASSGTLRVYVRRVPKDVAAYAPWQFDANSSVWSASGNKGNRWQRAFVNLGAINEEFQVIIEGVRGGSYLSDMAIDDVDVIEECSGDDPLGGGDAASSTDISSSTSSNEPSFDFSAAFSCYQRCGAVVEEGEGCDCSDACSDARRCCPDYEAWCLDFVDNGTSTAWTDGFEYETISSSTAAPSTPELLAFVSDEVTFVTATASTEVEFSGGVAETTTQPITTRSSPSSSEHSSTAPPPTRSTPMATTQPPPPLTTTTWQPMKEVLQHEIDTPTAVTTNESAPFAQASTLLAVGGVCMVSVLIGVLAVGVRRRWWCTRIRTHRWRSATSESDVRFLSNDEILDFNLSY